VARLVFVLSAVSSLAVAVACGSSSRSDSALFGSGAPPTGGHDAGASSGGETATGGASSASSGGEASTGGTGEPGGSGGVASGGSGGAESSGGAGATDAGQVTGGAGGSAGSGGAVGSGGAAGSGGATGSGGVSGGAWAKCATDSECTGGRVCTQSSQSIIVSGRSGACVHKCPVTTGIAPCDPPPPGGTVGCTQLLVTSYCSITCGAASPGCPAGMDCVAGYCFYSTK
jgi:hypothetical protein